MPIATGIPAAQYLRMSTDHQQYSLDNQADAIARYAAQHGFQIVKTYSDAAKSGLRLKNRAGLKQLLTDVMEGQLVCRAVLVYDVSRWGRFQDLDEAAHCEYLCKSSGVPVHYCAEMFSNDNSMLNLIYKALKRGMAAEYSRELSVKVKAGLVRLARLGYKLGGSAPYGLRRQLLDIQDRPKQVLEYGERKSLASEHVIFIPGPPEEVNIVRRIFREFADEHRSPNLIAARLNRERIPYLRGATWKGNTLRVLLQDTHYIGMQVWGRTTGFLSGQLTRLMASEYSRELGVRTLAGMQRLARLGFRTGSEPGYGLRRMLVSPDGTRKQLLDPGQWKGIASDHVILVPGPPEEVRVVRNIFRMLVEEKLSIQAIAERLNDSGVPYTGRSLSRWDFFRVRRVLIHPKYCGCQVYNRTSERLATPSVRLPESEWIVRPGAFTPLVDGATFAKAQKVLRQRRVTRRSDEEMLDKLQKVLTVKGRLSSRLIGSSRGVPSPRSYQKRFGGLRRAYQLIGYDNPHLFGPQDLARRIKVLREQLARSIADLFPGKVTIVRRPGNKRCRLQVCARVVVAVRIVRVIRRRGSIVWKVERALEDCAYPTLLARLNTRNDSFFDYHILPNVDRLGTFSLRRRDAWLNRGQRLAQLSQFCEVLAKVRESLE